MGKIHKFVSFAFLTFCISASAQEQPKVSQSIDRALWCGSLFAGLMRTEGLDKIKVDSFIAKSVKSFAFAEIEMDRDNIPKGNREQIIYFYTHYSYEDLDNEDHPMRYKPSECEKQLIEAQ